MAVPQRRPKTAETFARIPHDKGLALYRSRIGRGAWAILIELDRLILKAGGRRLWSPKLRDAGVTKQTRARALRELQAAGGGEGGQRGGGGGARGDPSLVHAAGVDGVTDDTLHGVIGNTPRCHW